MSKTTGSTCDLSEEVGGTFRKIVADGIEKYTDPERPLKDAGQRAIDRFVHEFPEYDNEPSIGLLIDLFAYFGLSDGQLERLTYAIANDGLRAVYVATEYMYMIGKRGRVADDTTTKGHGNSPSTMIAKLAAFIGCTASATGVSIDSAEALYDVIEELGGFDRALKLKDEDVIVQKLEARPIVEQVNPADKSLMYEKEDEVVFDVEERLLAAGR